MGEEKEEGRVGKDGWVGMMPMGPTMNERAHFRLARESLWAESRTLSLCYLELMSECMAR